MNVEYTGYPGTLVALIASIMKEIGGTYIPFLGEKVEVLEKWDLESEELTKIDASIQGGQPIQEDQRTPTPKTILLPYHGVPNFPFKNFGFTISRWNDFPEEIPHVQAGMPALDRFFKGDVPSKKELFEPIELESSSFTIVYALTWKERKDGSSSMRKMESWINRLPPEVNLVVINHPLIRYASNLSKKLELILESRPNSHSIYNQKDTFEWLNTADLIICDSGSGIVLNTPCFKAPVLQIGYPYHHKSGYDYSWAVDYDYSWAVEVEAEEIPDNIFTSFMGDRKSAIEKHLYKFDGKATERAVAGIKGFLEK